MGRRIKHNGEISNGSPKKRCCQWYVVLLTLLVLGGLGGLGYWLIKKYYCAPTARPVEPVEVPVDGYDPEEILAVPYVLTSRVEESSIPETPSRRLLFKIFCLSGDSFREGKSGD